MPRRKGGRYVTDPKTGESTLVDQTHPAGTKTPVEQPVKADKKPVKKENDRGI